MTSIDPLYMIIDTYWYKCASNPNKIRWLSQNWETMSIQPANLNVFQNGPRKIIKNLQLVIWKPMVHSGPKFFTNPQKCHLNSPCPVASRQFQVDAFFGSRGCETLGVKGLRDRRFWSNFDTQICSINIIQISILIPKCFDTQISNFDIHLIICFLLGNLFFVTCFCLVNQSWIFRSRLVSRHPRHPGWIVATHFDS